MDQLEFRVDGMTQDHERQLRKLHRPTGVSAGGVAATVVAMLVAYSVATSGSLRTRIAQEADVSALQAAQAIKLARITNANGEVVFAEAVDKAKTIKRVAEADSREAVDVIDIRFISVGGTTAAVITPMHRAVTVQYTVSGTDTYYDSRAMQTDSSGSVSFLIPRARSGVIDTISVSAVLSGVTAATKFTW